MEIKVFTDRFLAIQNEAQTWVPSWKDLAKYLNPTRGFFEGDIPNRGKKIDHQTVIDSHARRAIRTLASGMTSGLTSPSRPWFRLGFADETLTRFEPVKVWLETVTKTMMAVFSKSNIYGGFNSIYEEVGTFGTGAMGIFDDFHDVIRARNYTIGSYFLGCGPDGRVDTFGRRYWMTVGQMVDEFGIDKVSPSIRMEYQNNQKDRWIKIGHLVQPNKSRNPEKVDSGNLPFSSVHWEIGNANTGESAEKGALRLKGFHEFPILAPRWDLADTSEIYGRSPGWDALGDVKMLQKMQKDKLLGLDKVVDPPVQKDSNVQGRINTQPGGINKHSGQGANAGLKPVYQIQIDLAHLSQAIGEVKEAISEAFYSDLFKMMQSVQGSGITAREVIERHEEKLILLGPVIERLESELLDPLISRVFNMLLRNGMLPPPPQEIQGQDMQVVYISMLAQAQKMVGVAAITQQAALVASLAALDPTVVDVFDADAATREAADALGTPAAITRSEEEVAGIRKKRSQAQAAQNKAAVAQSMIDGAKKMSETQLGQGSALDAIAGTGGAPGQPGQPAPGGAA